MKYINAATNTVFVRTSAFENKEREHNKTILKMQKTQIKIVKRFARNSLVTIDKTWKVSIKKILLWFFTESSALVWCSHSLKIHLAR